MNEIFVGIILAAWAATAHGGNSPPAAPAAVEGTPRLVAESAAICAVQSYRSDILKELAKDKRYAATGGAVDLDKRLALQKDLRSADELIAQIKAMVKPNKALSCKDKLVWTLSTCVSISHEEGGETIDDYGSTHERITVSAGGGNVEISGTTAQKGCEADNVQSWLSELPASLLAASQ